MQESFNYGYVEEKVATTKKAVSQTVNPSQITNIRRYIYITYIKQNRAT